MTITDEERSRRLRGIWQGIVLIACPFFAYAVATEQLRAPVPVRVAAGAVGLIVGLAIARAIRPAPAYSAPPGTRAFEAYHTAALLEQCIHDRQVELHRTPDAARKAHLEREVEFLSAQLVANRAIVAADDRSPGRNRIGFEPFPG